MYKVTANEKFEFELKAQDVLSSDILEMGNGNFHIVKDNKSYNASIESMDYTSKTFVVKVNNQSFTLAIKDELDQLVRRMGLSVHGSAKLDNVKAPMPGLVLEILVTEGQEVTKGDSLIILEAMKMENVLKATGEGVIKSINVTQGEAVEKNHVLIDLK